MSTSWWHLRNQVRGSLKLLRFILWDLWVSVPNFMTIHPVVVKIFPSGQKEVDWRSNIAILRAVPLAWQKTHDSFMLKQLHAYMPRQRGCRNGDRQFKCDTSCFGAIAQFPNSSHTVDMLQFNVAPFFPQICSCFSLKCFFPNINMANKSNFTHSI